jgi:hypothetical protein
MLAYKLAARVLRVTGFALAGGVAGWLLVVVCGAVGWVRHSSHVDAWRDAFGCFYVGVAAGGAVGLYRSVRTGGKTSN